jgi:hypothetical protein
VHRGELARGNGAVEERTRRLQAAWTAPAC